MKLHTARFGEIDVTEERLITFENGIPGLEHFTTYCLLPADDKDESPFYFLQSTEESGLCFFLADPFSFYPNYEVNLDDSTLDQLDINDPDACARSFDPNRSRVPTRCDDESESPPNFEHSQSNRKTTGVKTGVRNQRTSSQASHCAGG